MAQEQIEEYTPGSPFPGVIGRTLDESTPAWPAPKRARAGAPNVVVVLWDDVGFGQLSPFGGLCDTPTLDRIAARGLRYSNFHTTALCTPTRGCLLTGRNHHCSGCRRSPRRHSASRPTTASSASNTASCPRCSSSTATTRSPSASGTSPRRPSRPPPGRSTGGRSVGGSSGSTASWRGSTDQWFPDLVYDNHPSPHPPRRRTATTSTSISPTTPSSS